MIPTMNLTMILNVSNRKRSNPTEFAQHNDHLSDRVLPRHRHLQNLKIDKVGQKRDPSQNRGNQEEP